LLLLHYLLLLWLLRGCNILLHFCSHKPKTPFIDLTRLSIVIKIELRFGFTLWLGVFLIVLDLGSCKKTVNAAGFQRAELQD
jgi:hypothetical protein